jgi:hypothetical protein
MALVLRLDSPLAFGSPARVYVKKIDMFSRWGGMALLPTMSSKRKSRARARIPLFVPPQPFVAADQVG